MARRSTPRADPTPVLDVPDPGLPPSDVDDHESAGDDRSATIAPADSHWSAWFDKGIRASDDFLDERDQRAGDVRDTL